MNYAQDFMQCLHHAGVTPVRSDSWPVPQSRDAAPVQTWMLNAYVDEQHSEVTR